MNRRLSILLIILGVSSAKAQYTDQINSNRPGSSIGAFSVGKNVIQAEAGLALRYFTHAGYNNSTFRGSISFLSLRWGFLFETLELPELYFCNFTYFNLQFTASSISFLAKS